MPSTEVSVTGKNIISLYFPENFTVQVLHLGKSEIHIRVSPVTPSPVPVVPAVPEPWDIPKEALAYCGSKGIQEDFEKILGIVKESFPDMRKGKVSLEEHEVLGWSVLIEGEVLGTPDNIARRTWDCLGLWADAVSRDSSVYFLLTVHPAEE